MKRRREEPKKEGQDPRNTNREMRAKSIEETSKEAEVMKEMSQGEGRERPLEEELERYLEIDKKDKIDKIHRIDMVDRRKKMTEDIGTEPQVVIDTEEDS